MWPGNWKMESTTFCFPENWKLVTKKWNLYLFALKLSRFNYLIHRTVAREGEKKKKKKARACSFLPVSHFCLFSSILLNINIIIIHQLYNHHLHRGYNQHSSNYPSNSDVSNYLLIKFTQL